MDDNLDMGYNYIRFITWNLDYWKRTCSDRSCFFYKSSESINSWKEFVKYNLLQLQADFVLLQEVNPYFLYDLNYGQNETSCYKFKIDRSDIYYHEFAKILKQENVDKADYWGSAIIADEKYKLLDKCLRHDNNFFMCYDFQLNSDKTVSVVNFYNKAQYGKYSFNGDFIKSLNALVELKKENLIIFAGDFNSNANDYMGKQVFEDIVKMGFIDKTSHIGTTMVNYEYQNDHIFVNKKMNECIKDIQKFSQWNITDHYGLSCTIKI